MEIFENLTEVKTGSQEIFDGVILMYLKIRWSCPTATPPQEK